MYRVYITTFICTIVILCGCGEFHSMNSSQYDYINMCTQKVSLYSIINGEEHSSLLLDIPSEDRKSMFYTRPTSKRSDKVFLSPFEEDIKRYKITGIAIVLNSQPKVKVIHKYDEDPSKRDPIFDLRDYKKGSWKGHFSFTFTDDFFKNGKVVVD